MSWDAKHGFLNGNSFASLHGPAHVIPRLEMYIPIQSLNQEALEGSS